VALLVVLSLVLYAGSLRNGFVSDDDFQILGNRLITDVRNIPRIFTSNVWAFAGEETTNYYRPLHMLIYMAEYHLFGFDPFKWHLANLGLHVAALLAAYALARALAGERLALWAGLWFALHPIHVEAVVWVAVLTDLVCGLALFGGLFFYHRARAGERAALWHSLAALAFLAGLLVKETALVFPALLLAYDYLYRRESVREVLRGLARYLPYVAVLVAYVAARLAVLGSFAPTAGKYHQLTGWELFLSAPLLLGQYVWKLLVPVNLNYYYFFEPTRALGWKPLAGFALAGLLVGAAFWLRRRQPLVAFSAAWFLLTLAPVLNIPNVAENVFTERYLYIPSFGFAIAAAWAWLAWLDRATTPAARRVAQGALAAVFVFYAAQTVRRIPDWHDDLRLFSRTAEQSPRSATIQANLGYIYYLHGNVDRSIEFYRRALELDPNRALTHNNLGNSLSARGEYDEAIRHLRRATELKKDYPAAWLNLGLVYAAKKEWEQAVECYRRAIELRPRFHEAFTAMGLALWSGGRAEEAVAAYRKALEFEPSYIEARINLASALSELGSTDEAIEHLLAAVRINPRSPQAAVAHFNLGVNYERKGRWEAAVSEYERALVLNPGFLQARQRLEGLRRTTSAPQKTSPTRPF
jgi:tetratricopeptide (TPR) repeat protein